MRDNGFSLLGRDMAVDLGTANTLVYVRGRGIVLNEPSVVAVNVKDGRPLAVGAEAKRMIGRTPSHIQAIRPLKDGVIADFEICEKMLRYFIHRVHQRRFAKPRMVICVPSGITGVEQRAVMEAAEYAGARKAYIIEEPMAAAIGAGLPVHEPTGNMVVDIGGGTTEVAVISLGGIVTSQSIRIGGDELDEAIVSFVKKEYSLALGERTAEEIKIALGSAYELEEELHAEIRGRDLVTGLPKTVVISTQEIRKAIDEPVAAIVDAVKVTLDRTPPELAADIMEQGIVLTGGGAPAARARQPAHPGDGHAHRGGPRSPQSASPSAVASASRSSRPSSRSSSPHRPAERPEGTSPVAKARRSRRPRTTLLLLLLASVTIITLDARGGFHRITSGVKSVAADAFSPVRTGVDDIIEPIGSFLAGSVHYGAVRQQNQKLQQEIDQLHEQQASQQDAVQALKQLSALSSLPFISNLQTVPAEVSDFDSSDFAATIDISVGRDQGVQLNMPVVGVRRADRAGRPSQPQHGHGAPDHRRPVVGRGPLRVGRHTLAVLNGQGAGKPLSAQLVPNNTPLPVGEVFTTSGLQGASYPGGIPVATVVATEDRGHLVRGVGQARAAGRSGPSPLRVRRALGSVIVTAAPSRRLRRPEPGGDHAVARR